LPLTIDINAAHQPRLGPMLIAGFLILARLAYTKLPVRRLLRALH
jgi:hypothetical protein